MKIKIQNLGALKQADFTIGDLTIICGNNNTGKTYATYALFGFLYTWRKIFSLKINVAKIKQLLEEGVTRFDITEYVKQAEKIFSEGCKKYTQQLPDFFAASANRFKDTEFEINFDMNNISLIGAFERKMNAANAELFLMSKSEKSTELVVTLLAKKEKLKIPTHILNLIIADALKEIIFSQFLPTPFIASAERTGAAIFRNELNFARNRLLETLGQVDNIDLLKEHQDYALPIKTNVDFIRQLETIVKKNSFIAEKHPDVLEDFADIIEGEYTVTRYDELYYVPNKSKRVKLSMDESSSAVRSLLDIGFYLQHQAKVGDLLMVDEPELNLHPENQCRVARLLVRLVNLGIKVFVTTHSDYIIKELNTLIMLNHDKPHLKNIAEQEGYKKEELLSSEKIRVYIAEEKLIKPKGKKRKTKCQTLVPADIDPKLGIEARSFDKTIEKMNRIQEKILWGGE